MRLRIFAILVVIILTGCIPDLEHTDKVEDETAPSVGDILLGYCPTMANIAGEIAENRSHISLKAFGSTSSAISALNAGDIDVILVGRIAKSYELDAFEKRLRGGFTLVGETKRFISMDELENSRIHTAATEEEVSQYLQDKAGIIYHDSVDEAIEEGLSEIVLLNWEDYTDDMGLVIPLKGMNKVESFRIPVLYSYDKDTLDSLNDV